MQFEPAFQEHLDAIVAVATAPSSSVEAWQVGASLTGAATAAETLLANLAAGGLLCERGAGSGREPVYGLARPPEEITLEEIATVADAAGSTREVMRSTAAATGTHMLSRAVQQRARSVLAAFSLADVVASSVSRTDTPAPPPQAVDHGSPTGARASAPDDYCSARLGITVAQLRQRVDAGDVPLVIDVRERPDSRWPAPPWAHWIPLHNLIDHVPGQWHDTRIVTVCRLGVRSLVAASYLRACGFSRCDPLIGGLEAWNSDRG